MFNNRLHFLSLSANLLIYKYIIYKWDIYPEMQQKRSNFTPLKHSWVNLLFELSFNHCGGWDVFTDPSNFAF